jgi:hypothetical protein
MTVRVRNLLVPLVVVCAAGASCHRGKPNTAPPPSRRSPAETVTVRDPQLEQQVARLELRLLERDALIEQLQSRLDDARQEVVRTLAKLQTTASRAEAASAMAEAEVSLQTLRGTSGAQGAPEVAQAANLLQLGTAEFDKQNYGGALYLANQAKALAGAGRDRLLVGGAQADLRPGEVLFALPLELQTTGRANVREGPSSSARVVFSLDTGAPVTGYSYSDLWVRVSDATGRTGWVFHSLVGRR